MDATIEISLYPLTDNYKQVVLDFIENLKKYPNIVIETNGLSTQIFGDFDVLMKDVITEQMKLIWEQQAAILVMKMGRGTLRFGDK